MGEGSRALEAGEAGARIDQLDECPISGLQDLPGQANAAMFEVMGVERDPRYGPLRLSDRRLQDRHVPRRLDPYGFEHVLRSDRLVAPRENLELRRRDVRGHGLAVEARR